MNLTGAAILSGMGNSAKEAIGEQQKFNLLKQLEDSRQDMESMRQERNLSAQRAMHTEQLKAAADQGELTREHATSIANAHNKVLGDIEEKRAASAKEIAGEHNKTQTDIASEHNKVSERIANQADTTKQRELTLADQHATLTSLNKELKELREDNSMIAVKMATLASDPLKTTDNPEYKALSAMYKRNLGLISGYSDRLGKQLGVAAPKDDGGITRPGIKNAFGVPSGPATPSVALPPPGSASVTPPVRGTMQMPMPSDEEQGLMQKALQE